MVPVALTPIAAEIVREGGAFKIDKEIAPSAVEEAVAREVADLPHHFVRRFAPPREFKRVHGRRTASLRSRSNRRKHR